MVGGLGPEANPYHGYGNGGDGHFYQKYDISSAYKYGLKGVILLEVKAG